VPGGQKVFHLGIKEERVLQNSKNEAGMSLKTKARSRKLRRQSQNVYENKAT
jgi:hypothetical protein